MSNMNKIFSVVLVLLLSFGALPSLAKAQTSPFSMVVEVDGDVVSAADVVSVERGSTVDVKIRFISSVDAEGVRLEAEVKALKMKT